MKKDISFIYEKPRRKSVGTLEKVSSLFKLKKVTKRSTLGSSLCLLSFISLLPSSFLFLIFPSGWDSELLHQLKNAVRDKNSILASYFANKLNVDIARKKDPVTLSRVFVMAMMAGMVAVVLQLLEKGFPKDVNAPALEIILDGAAESGNSNSRLETPSYFILAVSYGLEDVVNAMTRVTRR